MIAKYQKHILLISLFKLFILFLLPLTGDEAYFIKWGNHLSLGYYDHPPMVGWLIYLMQYINHSYLTFRFFSFFTVFILSYLIYKILVLLDIPKERAQFSAIVFLLMPIDVLIILFTNDIPLLLFGTLGTYFLLRSFKYHYLTNAIAAGIFFGLSFLSKYFIVFLMLGVLLYILQKYKKSAFKNIIIVVLAFSPFVLENLYFNYTSCWNNIMFNFFARTEDLHYNFFSLLNYIGILIYIISPWGIYYLFKSKTYTNPHLKKFIFTIMSIGLLVFLIVSLKKSIGLHWLLLFTPYLFMLFSFIDSKYYDVLMKKNLLFTYMHIGILILILMLPHSLLEKHKHYKEILLFTNSSQICHNIQAYQNLYTTNYTSASILSYHCSKDIKMILNNSKYGRMDDTLVNIKELENKDVNIFYTSASKLKNIQKVFQEVQVEEFEVLNQKYYVAKCKNLNFTTYKKNYLDIQKEKFYTIPSFLPKGKCYFCERYYP